MFTEGGEMLVLLVMIVMVFFMFFCSRQLSFYLLVMIVMFLENYDHHSIPFLTTRFQQRGISRLDSLKHAFSSWSMVTSRCCATSNHFFVSRASTGTHTHTYEGCLLPAYVRKLFGFGEANIDHDLSPPPSSMAGTGTRAGGKRGF